MTPDSLPPIKSVYRALENAAVDLFGFAVVCHGGAPAFAEPDLYDTLFLGLENFWFRESELADLDHEEFREEFFRALWQRCRDKPAPAPLRVGTDVPLGHEEIAFFQLPQFPRAALYLRTKKHFSYSSVALILGSPEALVRTEVERAREFLLGRRLRLPEWDEEGF